MLAKKDSNDHLTLVNVGGKVMNASETRDVVLKVFTLVVPHNIETRDWYPVSISFYE